MRTLLVPMVFPAVIACAPPEGLELGTGTNTQRDITTVTKQLVVDADISTDAARFGRTITLSVDEHIVWSCVLAAKERAMNDRMPECTSDDESWYRGPGLYTFAMANDFAADVWVHDDVIRVELRVAGTIENNMLELWHVGAHAFTNGNDIATLKTGPHGMSSVSFLNASGVDVLKQSMTAALEKWDGTTWRTMPRAPIFLCGTGWNPLVSADEEDHVYLPLGAHRRAMAQESIEQRGTYRVSYPFRVVDEEEPRIASVILELEDEDEAMRE